MENNWRYKTSENLEKVEWPHFDGDSRLMKRIKQLRKIPLNEFTTEDLRLMIGQRIGLDYTMVMALEVLTEDLFAEGDFYPGDLLKSLLELHHHVWENRKQYWQTLNNLIKGRLKELGELKIKTDEFYHIIQWR
jgi:hypothetical protein